jgi:hypothetical protein
MSDQIRVWHALARVPQHCSLYFYNFYSLARTAMLKHACQRVPKSLGIVLAGVGTQGLEFDPPVMVAGL